MQIAVLHLYKSAYSENIIGHIGLRDENANNKVTDVELTSDEAFSIMLEVNELLAEIAKKSIRALAAQEIQPAIALIGAPQPCHNIIDVSPFPDATGENDDLPF